MTAKKIPETKGHRAKRLEARALRLEAIESLPFAKTISALWLSVEHTELSILAVQGADCYYTFPAQLHGFMPKWVVDESPGLIRVISTRDRCVRHAYQAGPRLERLWYDNLDVPFLPF